MNNKKPLPNKPIYLVAETSPLIEEYANVVDMFTADESLHTLVIHVPPDAVSGKDVDMITELVCALQHAPHLIERFVFALEFKFLQVENSELYFDDMYWKTDSAYHRWFQKVGEGYANIFFIHDRDARFYALAGDLLADGKGDIRHDEGDKASYIGFGGKELNLLCDRLFTACWMFHLYCHASGFDPKHMIEGLIAEFDLPIFYKHIRDKYKKDIKAGIRLRIVKETEEGETIL
jgi:hypothetical protein